MHTGSWFSQAPRASAADYVHPDAGTMRVGRLLPGKFATPTNVAD